MPTRDVNRQISNDQSASGGLSLPAVHYGDWASSGSMPIRSLTAQRNSACSRGNALWFGSRHDRAETGFDPIRRRLCHLAGRELEQIQFLRGHALVQTTERYLGCKQKLSQAVNDHLGLEDT
jgi:hypothetical protein